MSSLSEKLTSSIVIFDGAMGTELYRRNFFVNAFYEQLCLTLPDTVLEIHRKYFEAGAVELAVFDGGLKNSAKEIF